MERLAELKDLKIPEPDWHVFLRALPDDLLRGVAESAELADHVSSAIARDMLRHREAGLGR